MCILSSPDTPLCLYCATDSSRLPPSGRLAVLIEVPQVATSPDLGSGTIAVYSCTLRSMQGEPKSSHAAEYDMRVGRR